MSLADFKNKSGFAAGVLLLAAQAIEPADANHDSHNHGKRPDTRHVTLRAYNVKLTPDPNCQVAGRPSIDEPAPVVFLGRTGVAGPAQTCFTFNTTGTVCDTDSGRCINAEFNGFAGAVLPLDNTARPLGPKFEVRSQIEISFPDADNQKRCPPDIVNTRDLVTLNADGSADEILAQVANVSPSHGQKFENVVLTGRNVDVFGPGPSTYYGEGTMNRINSLGCFEFNR